MKGHVKRQKKKRPQKCKKMKNDRHQGEKVQLMSLMSRQRLLAQGLTPLFAPCYLEAHCCP